MAITTTFHYFAKLTLKDTSLLLLTQDLEMDGQIALINVLTTVVTNVYNVKHQSGVIRPDNANIFNLLTSLSNGPN